MLSNVQENDPDEEIRTGGDIGHIIGHVVRHPRIEGYWLAMWPPLTSRDCGMKKYKTRSGAVSRVRREWTLALERAERPQRLRKQLLAAVAKVGVPEAVRRIKSIAQDHEDP